MEPTAVPFPTLIRIGDMELHADLSQRAVLDTHGLAWVSSPMDGVERRMLDRRGGEVARASSIVRYAPGSRFEQHHHGGGEEILVLEGTFSDEHGDYPAGTYLRNPVGSEHAPFSEQGCTILVKLQQMNPDDRQRLVIDTINAAWLPGLVSGLQVLPLQSFGSEHVALVRWAPGTVFQPHGHPAAARRSWCWRASFRTSTRATPRAPGCVIHPAVCTGPGVRPAARSGSRPATCQRPRGLTAQKGEPSLRSGLEDPSRTQLGGKILASSSLAACQSSTRAAFGVR